MADACRTAHRGQTGILNNLFRTVNVCPHPAADGYYAGKKSADGVCDVIGYHLISELRHDANLRCLYEAPGQTGSV